MTLRGFGLRTGVAYRGWIIRANRRWERNAKPGMTCQHYVRTVVPALPNVKLSELMAATGLTNASCSRIRRGSRGRSRGIGRRWLGCDRPLMTASVSCDAPVVRAGTPSQK